MFEEDGRRVFSAVREYLTVKFRYLGDAKTDEPARLMELTYVSVRSAIFISSADTRKASNSEYSTKGTGSRFAIALNFLIIFSGLSGEGYSTFCSGWTEQSGM